MIARKTLLLILSLLVFFYLGSHHFFGVSEKDFRDALFAQGPIFDFVKKACFALLAFWTAQQIIRLGEEHIQTFSHVRSSNRSLLVNIVSVFVYFVAGILALDFFGLNLSSFSFMSAAFVVSIGFGLQKIFLNFISGLVILLEDPFEEGNLVELPNGLKGIVRRIGRLYTLIEKRDGGEILIPNGELINNNLINWTHSHTMVRSELVFVVPYSADIQEIKKLALEAATQHPLCSKKVEPLFYCNLLRDNGVEVSLLFWIDNIFQGKRAVESDILQNMLVSFREHNISIARPVREIHSI